MLEPGGSSTSSADDVSVPPRAARPGRACSSVHAIDRPDLKDEHVGHRRDQGAARSRAPQDDGGMLLRSIHERDLLTHHPYESFATSVEEFVRQPADSPPRAVDQDDALSHVGRPRSSRRT